MTGRSGVTYRSTQSAYIIPLVLAVASVAAGFWAASTDDDAALIAWAVLAFVTIVGFMFSRLTVLVGKGQVLAEFGLGWPRRRHRLDEVTGIEQVRNKWWHGWGLRWIPNGTMFNVWGLDAVELQLESGKVFRIGTDEPAQLKAALEAEQARLGPRSMLDSSGDDDPAGD
jgi:hypothetical protein